jgi:hypothetical protein
VVDGLPNVIEGMESVPLDIAPNTPFEFIKVHTYEVTSGDEALELKFTVCVGSPVHFV